MKSNALRLVGSAFSLAFLLGCTASQTQTSSSSRIADRFAQSDANGDGFISEAEAPSRIDFEAADANGDGLISMSEIETYTQNLRS